jgi:hypothetical protein
LGLFGFCHSTLFLSRPVTIGAGGCEANGGLAKVGTLKIKKKVAEDREYNFRD